MLSHFAKKHVSRLCLTLARDNCVLCRRNDLSSILSKLMMLLWKNAEASNHARVLNKHLIFCVQVFRTGRRLDSSHTKQISSGFIVINLLFLFCLVPGWIITLNTQAKFHCKHLQLIPSTAPSPPRVTILHIADHIRLFAVAEFCGHFVWKGCTAPSLIVFVIETNHHQCELSCAARSLSQSPEPRWVCTTANSQCDLY